MSAISLSNATETEHCLSEPSLSTTQQSSQSEHEDYPLSAVPANKRKSCLSLLGVLLGFTFYSATLFGGGTIGSAFPFWPDMVTVLILGNLLLAIYAALLGYIAFKTGLSTVLLARFCFGNAGGRLADFVLVVTQLGWYAWGTTLIVKILNQLAGVPPHYNVILMLFFSFVFCITAYIGYRGLDWLSRIAVPAMVILIIWSLSLGITKIGGISNLQFIQPLHHLSWSAAITIIVGTFVAGATQATNWSRFAPSPKAAIWATLFAFLFGNGLLTFTGAFGTMIYGNPDIVQIMATQGLTIAAFILLFLNMWTTQDNTIYNFSIAGANMVRSPRRHFFIWLGAFIAFLLSWGGVDQYLVSYLTFLGIFIPPIGGLIMADYWMLSRKHGYELENYKKSMNWPGLLAYASACLIAVYAPGIKPLNGILSAITFYAIFNFMFNWLSKINKMRNSTDVNLCET